MTASFLYLVSCLETTTSDIASVLGEYLSSSITGYTVLDGDSLYSCCVTQSYCLAIESAL